LSWILAGFVLSNGAGAIMTEEIVLGIIIALLAPAMISYSTFATSKANDITVGIVVLVLGFANALYRQSPVRTHA
jgi:hypothetical protein